MNTTAATREIDGTLSTEHEHPSKPPSPNGHATATLPPAPGGSLPRPSSLVPPAARPPMTAKEASYHKVQAGRRAMDEAQRQGAPPESVDALMLTEDTVIAGITLRPLTLAVTWALEAVGSVYAGGQGAGAMGQGEAAEAKPGARPSEAAEDIPIGAKDVALAALCFSDPVGAYKLARNGEREALEDRAIELAAALTFPDMQRLNEWMNKQFALVRKLSGADEEGEEEDAATSEGRAPAEKKTGA